MNEDAGSMTSALAQHFRARFFELVREKVSPTKQFSVGAVVIPEYFNILI